MKHYLLIFPHLRNKHDFGGQRSRHIVESMIRNGISVSVVVPLKDSMTGKNVKKKTWGLYIKDETFIKGGAIYFANATNNNRKKLSTRVLYMLTTSLSVLAAAVRVRNVDAVISVSLPFTFMLIGHICSKLRKVPHIVEVRDIGIEVAAEIGLISRGIIYKSVKRMEDYLYKAADRVIVVSEGFKERLIERGVDKDNIDVVELGYDGYEEEQREGDVDWCLPDDKFIVLYSGNLGHVFNIDLLLDAAKLLRSDRNVMFVILGGGQNLEHFKAKAEADMSNVVFLGNKPKLAVSYYCKNADLCLYPAKRGLNVNSMLGNKIFDYLGAGTATLYAGEGGDVADLIKRINGGVSCTDDPEVLADNILDLANNEDVDVMGENARLFIKENYLAHGMAEKYTSIIRDVG